MNINSTRRREAGFSLFELIIAMSVMLIISATVFTLMGNSIKVGATATEMANAQEALRTAHNTSTAI